MHKRSEGKISSKEMISQSTQALLLLKYKWILNINTNMEGNVLFNNTLNTF